MRKMLKILGFFFIGFVFLGAALKLSEVDLSLVAANALKANPYYILLGLGFFWLTFLVRGLRWKLLLGGVGKPKGMYIPQIIMSFFVNCVAPGRLGEFYRAYLMKKEGFSGSKAFSMIVVERFFDVLSALSILCLSAYLVFRGELPPWVSQSIQLIFAFLVAALTFIFVLHKSSGRFNSRRLTELMEGFQSVKSPLVLSKVMLLSLSMWVIDALHIGSVLYAFGLVLPVDKLFLLVSGIAVVYIIPFSPGAMGFVEGAYVFILGVFGIGKDIAWSITILDRFITLWGLILVGAVLFMLYHAKLEFSAKGLEE